MELTAAIKALEYFEIKKELIIYTDSKYVKDGIESWITNWKKNGWKTSTKKIVKNKYELKIKIEAFKCYKSEVNKFPHPRSIEVINSISKIRGMESGLKNAEAFKIIRDISE